MQLTLRLHSVLQPEAGLGDGAVCVEFNTDFMTLGSEGRWDTVTTVISKRGRGGQTSIEDFKVVVLTVFLFSLNAHICELNLETNAPTKF